MPPVTSHRTRPFSANQRLPKLDEPSVLHEPEQAGELLAEFIHRHPKLLILTGAGVSTDLWHSGLSRWRRCLEAQAAGSAPGFHGKL